MMTMKTIEKKQFWKTELHKHKLGKKRTEGHISYNRLFFGIGLVVVMLFAGIGVVGATTYYVAPGGNDSKTGLSLGEAWATLDHADDYVKNPGDILYIAEGEYQGQQFIAQGSGTAENPIIIKSLTDNAENAILDGDSYINNGGKYTKKMHIKKEP